MFLAQNIQEIWHTMKRPNLRIVRVKEQLQLKGTENTFNKIIEENFPNLKKYIPMRYKKLKEQWVDYNKQTNKSPLTI